VVPGVGVRALEGSQFAPHAVFPTACPGKLPGCDEKLLGGICISLGCARRTTRNREKSLYLPNRKSGQKIYRSTCYLNRLQPSLRWESNFFSCNVALGEPNSQNLNSSGPAVNGFPTPRRLRSSPQNPLSCKRLADFGLRWPFSVPESNSLGTRRNRQGCDRTPRFLAPNSLILWLIWPSG
jgi:hypothetical protein